MNKTYTFPDKFFIKSTKYHEYHIKKIQNFRRLTNLRVLCYRISQREQMETIFMDDIEQLKPFLSKFLQENYGITNFNKNFRCIAGTHPDNHPSMHYHAKEHYVKCFSCGFTGNIVTVAAHYWNISKVEAVRRLKEQYLGISMHSKTTDPMEQFLKKRGLSEKTAKHFNLSFIKNFNPEKEGTTRTNYILHDVIKIPAGENSESYILRSIHQKKFYKPTGIVESLFFKEELSQTEPVFITESAICAMSIWQCGGHAVALNGTGYQKLLEQLKKEKNPPTLILSLDNDEAGKKATTALYEELFAMNIPVVNFPVSKDKKDPNELLVESSKLLTEEIQKAVRAAKATEKPAGMMCDYIAYSFIEDILTQQKNAQKRSTGFSMLDQKLNGFGSGLYIFGGRPGIGKSTFLDQIAYTLSKQTPVIYFSYEQQKRHFAAKQLSRLSFLKNEAPFKSSDLLAGKFNKNVPKIIEQYLNENPDLQMYSDVFTLDELQEKIQIYEQRSGKSPIVFVDFIQKIPVSVKGSAKEAVDAVVSSMEKFTHKEDRTIVLVSSFNRGGYYSPISMDSFRETGNLEYAADALIGLQYQIVSSSHIFQSDTRFSEKQLLIRKEEQKTCREVEFSCVKNRYGSQFTMPLLYYTEYDCFTEPTKKSAGRI